MSTYEQWRTQLNLRMNGKARGLGPEYILAAVRSFYLDLQSWAVEEPERWAQWAAPCPVAADGGRRSRTRRRRVTERIADRIRERQPWLPTLVTHVEQRHAELRDLLAVAEKVDPGAEFTHGGHSYRRTNTQHDRQLTARGYLQVRVEDTLSGDVTNLTLAEDAAS